MSTDDRRPGMIARADDTLDAIAAGASAEPRVARAPLREPIREEDPRERARKRAAELTDAIDSMEDGDNQFDIDRSIIPPGWDYEWKRMTVYGQRDAAYEVSLARGGWEPVPLSRHPSEMPVGWAGNTIERDGMQLMERPLEITERVRERARKNASEQLRSKQEQLTAAPKGHFERDKKVSGVKRGEYEPVPIPDDDEG